MRKLCLKRTISNCFSFLIKNICIHTLVGYWKLEMLITLFLAY